MGLQEDLKFHGLEYVIRRYYSPCRAVVISNQDPDKNGRIQILCPAVGHTEDNWSDVWVYPAFGSGANHGSFNPPEERSTVEVWFEQGDPSRPGFYVGGWYGATDMPSEFAYSASGFPERRGIVTRGGHSLVFSDEPGKEQVQLIWHKPATGDVALTDRTKAADRTKGDFASVTLTNKGDIFASNRKSSYVHLDSENDQVAVVMQDSDHRMSSVVLRKTGVLVTDQHGNVIEINSSSDGINIIAKGPVNVVGSTVNLKAGSVFLAEGATQSAVLGEPLLAWLGAHSHGTGVGPSSPPLVPPLAPTLLSQKVKLT